MDFDFKQFLVYISDSIIRQKLQLHKSYNISILLYIFFIIISHHL